MAVRPHLLAEIETDAIALIGKNIKNRWLYLKSLSSVK